MEYCRTEKVDKMTAADLVALGKEFCAQTVDKLQHAGDLWLLNADDASTLMDAVLESFRIQDQHVSVHMHECVLVCVVVCAVWGFCRMDAVLESFRIQDQHMSHVTSID